LYLNALDQDRLHGKLGKAMQFAMETIVTAAHIEQADTLIDISFAHIDACFYNGRAHLDFVNYMLEHDATLAVPTWTNNGLVSLNDLSVRDPLASREMNEARQLMLAYVKLGCNPVWTCAPYQLPDRPELGAHIVGSESNAVSFYNSVIGARSNKYGDYLDVCAAIVGRVPLSKLHRDEERAAQVLFDLSNIAPSMRSNDLFYHLLGHAIGRKCGNRVPAILGLADDCSEDDLKAISAAASSSGSVPLFHAIGITPEAATLEIAFQGNRIQQTIACRVRAKLGTTACRNCTRNPAFLLHRVRTPGPVTRWSQATCRTGLLSDYQSPRLSAGTAAGLDRHIAAGWYQDYYRHLYLFLTRGKRPAGQDHDQFSQVGILRTRNATGGGGHRQSERMRRSGG